MKKKECCDGERCMKSNCCKKAPKDGSQLHIHGEGVVATGGFVRTIKVGYLGDANVAIGMESENRKSGGK